MAKAMRFVGYKRGSLQVLRLWIAATVLYGQHASSATTHYASITTEFKSSLIVIKMKLRFKNLRDLVLYRNLNRMEYLCGAERSDIKARLARHRFAKSSDIKAKTSSDDRSCLGTNSRWNLAILMWLMIQRAIAQYPQSSTEYESNCSCFLLYV